MKPITFLGTSLYDLCAFPNAARREAGHQLDRVQRGLDPAGIRKPMAGIGPGVREAGVRERRGAFRVIYTANRSEAVYVLHAFEKRTQQTTKRDLDLAKARLRELVRIKR